MKFSIVCLTYKRTALLEESVFSVLQQTHQDFELLIINDYPSQRISFEHPKVRVFNLDKKINTLGEKRNFGLSNANGDLIIQLDDDDLFLPSYLKNLATLINNHGVDVLSPQRPIFYYSPDKICLSPRPMTNTLLYRRETVAFEFKYDHINFDELTPFYLRIKNARQFTHMSAQLSPEKCGYVYRQENFENRKYSMGEFKTESVEHQNTLLNSIKTEKEEGDITLVPKWSIDYTSIIQDKLKIISPVISVDMKKVISESTKENDSWNSVKPTWANALKFIEAVKSRGLFSTVLDVTGINKINGERVVDEIFKRRTLSCFGDKESGINSCHRLIHKENRGYFCGGCGCGNNDLARLDSDTPDGYTKLHYPELQCPLKKPGFSNYESPPLSIIMPVLNDNVEANLTVKSIYDTSPAEIEIIMIDDGSDIPVKVDDSRVKLFRFDKRIGAGQARHFGAQQAKSKHILFIDSHMRFDKYWFNNAIQRMKDNPQTLWCCTCLGLNELNMDINKPVGAYTGADLILYREKTNTIFDGVWRPDEKDKDDYEISCVMGACYFIHKDWYFHIKGLEQTMMWGSEEPILSIKTWLAGGDVRLMKSVKLGHKFRSVASYATNVSHIYYNKLAYSYMLFPKKLYRVLVDKIPNSGDKMMALQLVDQNKEKLDIEKEYYKSIFNERDIYWLCKKFNIEIPQ